MEIALSVTESECITLSQSFKNVTPIIALLYELKKATFHEASVRTLHCTVHENNQGCIDPVTCPQMRPRTKHIALKYHHFRKHVREGKISVQYMETGEQIADIFTKELGDVKFTKLRKMMMGW